MKARHKIFTNKFFEGLDVNTLKIGGKLSPKISHCKTQTLACLGNTITDVQKSGKCTKVLQESLEVILTIENEMKDI